jgi:hypothetical protein
MLKVKLAAVLAVTLISAPLSAKWTLMPEAARVPVAKSAMTVVPGQGWNASSVRPSNKGELWSFDGPVLNNVEFIAGIANGEPLAKERNKKREPLPKFSASMLPTDVAQAFEQTQRILTGSPDFAVEAMEPVSFAGRPGFRFTYRYTRPDDELTRRGQARGAVVGGKLYLISYTAAALHYYDAHLTKAQAIMDSATVN